MGEIPNTGNNCLEKILNYMSNNKFNSTLVKKKKKTKKIQKLNLVVIWTEFEQYEQNKQYEQMNNMNRNWTNTNKLRENVRNE